MTAVSNLVDSIMSCNLFIFTRDRDITDRKPYLMFSPTNGSLLEDAGFYTADCRWATFDGAFRNISMFTNSFFSRLTMRFVAAQALVCCHLRRWFGSARRLSPGALG